MENIIECFIDRANNELPFGYSVAADDEKRCVIVYKENTPIYLFSYYEIENDITGYLDLLPEVL